MTATITIGDAFRANAFTAARHADIATFAEILGLRSLRNDRHNAADLVHAGSAVRAAAAAVAPANVPAETGHGEQQERSGNNELHDFTCAIKRLIIAASVR
jgi:hypothetical protein